MNAIQRSPEYYELKKGVDKTLEQAVLAFCFDITGVVCLLSFLMCINDFQLCRENKISVAAPVVGMILSVIGLFRSLLFGLVFMLIILI